MNANLYSLFERHFPTAPSSHSSPSPMDPSSITTIWPRCRRRLRARWSRRDADPGTASPRKSTSTGTSSPCTWDVLRAGLVYLPLNTGYQRGELAISSGMRSRG
jgi:hypothetical protein